VVIEPEILLLTIYLFRVRTFLMYTYSIPATASTVCYCLFSLFERSVKLGCQLRLVLCRGLNRRFASFETHGKSEFRVLFFITPPGWHSRFHNIWLDEKLMDGVTERVLI
jgi:hypothetical protein